MTKVKITVSFEIDVDELEFDEDEHSSIQDTLDELVLDMQNDSLLISEYIPYQGAEITAELTD